MSQYAGIAKERLLAAEHVNIRATNADALHAHQRFIRGE